MTAWPDRRILDLLGIELPIVQAPMAGAATSAMVIAVAEVGGLGSLPCAILSGDQMRTELRTVRERTSKPVNMNFFCHRTPSIDAARETAWRRRLKPYYVELGLDPEMTTKTPAIEPFGGAHCELVEELKPEIVSFHFGLPDKGLVTRVKKTGAKILSSATTVEEARWLEENGCDAVIAQGAEAGGHRGTFLSDDISSQPGTLALVPQVVDAIGLPVIAAGGIADARGIVAAFALGAAAVQIGTSYLFCPEAHVAPAHRRALAAEGADQTVLTNIFSGRPARVILNRIVRELGPMSDLAPPFPLAGGALGPLRAKSEPSGSADFIPLWSGQAARLGRDLPAGELTKWLAKKALAKLAAS